MVGRKKYDNNRAPVIQPHAQQRVYSCMAGSVCCTCAGKIAPVTVRAFQRTLVHRGALSRL